MSCKPVLYNYSLITEHFVIDFTQAENTYLNFKRLQGDSFIALKFQDETISLNL